MLEDMELEFGSDDEIRSRPPAGTVANIQVRPDRDGNLPQSIGDFRSGKNDFGPWMIVNFEVVDGKFRGEWASTILNLKTDDRRFRATFKAITGIDIAGGGKVSVGEFVEKLVGGVFDAEIGPERRKRKSEDDQAFLKAVENGNAKADTPVGEFYETGFTSVARINGRVGERGAFAGAEPTPQIDAVGTSTDVDAGLDDEDVPF